VNKQLYQQTVLKHNRDPRNYGELSPCSHHAEGLNPLCGDEVQVYMQVDNNAVSELQFTGKGCAIMMASASIMTESLSGKNLTEADAQYIEFLEMTKGEKTDLEGELGAFSGICQFPSRVKCAELPWKTFKAALDDNHEKVSTE